MFIRDAVVSESGCSYLYSVGPLIAALALKDVAIIATDDGVLALPRKRVEQVNDLVETPRVQGRENLCFLRVLHRPGPRVAKSSAATASVL